MADDPWAEFRKPAQPAQGDPWAEFRKPAENSSDGWGLAKSAGVGLAKGLIGGTVALPGNMADLLGRGSDWAAEKITGEKPASAGKRAPFTSDYFEKKIEGVTGPFYKPKNTAEEYAQTAGEFVGDPTSYVGGGGVARKVGGALAGAVGSETAGQVAKKVAPDYEPLARIAGGAAGGTAASASRRPPHGVSVEDLEASGGRGFDALKNSNTMIDGRQFANVADQIEGQLRQEHFRPYLHPQTFAVVNEIQRHRGDVNMGDLTGFMQLLKNVGGEPGDRAAASHALELLSHYVDNVPANHMISGNAAADAQTLREANADWRGARRSDVVDMSRDRAERQAAAGGYGGNIDNTTRQRLNAILNSPTERRRFNQQELDAIDAAVRGTATGNTLRWIGKSFAPTGLKGGLSAGGAVLAGEPATAATLAGGGMAAKLGGDYMTKRAAQKIAQDIRNQTPYARRQPPQQPAVPATPFAVRGGLGAAPGALEAGGGSPLAPGRGADLGSLLAPSANAAEAPKNPWQKKPMIEAGRGGGGGFGSAPAPVSGIMSGISYRLPPAQYEELAAARRAGATKAELQSMIDRFSGKTPQAGAWSAEKEQQYRDYRRGGSPGQWQADFDAKLKQDLER